jgi:hypothetical protein
VAESLPLNALLSQTLAAVMATYVESGAGSGRLPSLPVWSNVLRPIGDGIAMADLPAAARLSKRTVRAAVGGAEKRGWVVTEGKQVRLAPAGEAARQAWPSLDAAVAARWPLDGLYDALSALVRQLYLEWPHYPAGYGPADDSVTGGVYTAGGGQIDSRVPTHADDWAPVLRADDDGSSVAGLPLSALLSQALVAFAADFEELWIGGLHHAATVLRLLPDEGAPIRDFPMLSKLPGNGKSVLERHLYVQIVRDPNNSKVKVAVPTARGRNTRDEYPGTVERVEARWAPKYSEPVVTALRTELEAVVADLDPTLPHYVIGALHLG